MATTELFPQPRRLRLMRVSVDFLLAMCKADAGVPRYARVVKDALPGDVAVAHIGYDQFGQLQVALRSAAFPHVPAGEMLPEVTPMFEVVTSEPPQYAHLLKRLVIALDAEQDEEAVDVLREARSALGFVLAEPDDAEENGDAGR